MHQTDTTTELSTVELRSELAAKAINISEIETREEAVNEMAEGEITLCETPF